jgi:hypothetical protein
MLRHMNRDDYYGALRVRLQEHEKKGTGYGYHTGTTQVTNTIKGRVRTLVWVT